MEDKKPVTTETSKKWRLSMPDFLRSGLTSLWVLVVSAIAQYVLIAIEAFEKTQTFHLDCAGLLGAVKFAVAAFVGDVIRRLLKESVTVIKIPK